MGFVSVFSCNGGFHTDLPHHFAARCIQPEWVNLNMHRWDFCRSALWQKRVCWIEKGCCIDSHSGKDS